MSVRGIGEGHRSSIGFRTGVVDAEGGVTVDAPARFATVGTVGSTLLDAAVFRSELARLRDAGEAADYVLDALGERFTRADLDEQLDALQTHMQHPRPRAADDFADSGHRRAVLRRRIRRRHTAVRAGAVAGDGRRGGGHGGRALRPIRRRRRVGQVLCHLYGLQRIPHQPAAAGDDGFPVVHVHADGWDAPRPTRAWRCFRVASAVALPPCRGQTANRIRLPIADDPSIWPNSVPCQQPDASLGGVAARQLRAADRNRGRVAGAHPRRRSDAHLQHRGDPARSGGADPDHRSTAASRC